MRKCNDRTQRWGLTYWNQMLVMMFGQLDGCNSLRELTDITSAHAKKSFHLGFGKTPINRSVLSKANQLRDYHIFEEFAYHMVALAQQNCINKEFELNGKYYAFDSTTIDLCMSLFELARFRSTKSGIKVHTQLDIVTQIPVSFNITEAVVHDVNAMDWINYEPLACYVFDRGYWDLNRLYRIEMLNSFFIIREKRKPKFEVVAGEDLLESNDNILRDHTVRFTTKGNRENYPSEIRRIVYYEPELRRTFTYYTNNFFMKAKDIAFLYKNRWTVETFFKWMKEHLRIKSFWGNTENAVRIQVYVAIIAYCTVAIIERKLVLNRSISEVMRILSVIDGLGYPDQGAGSNEQNLEMFFEGDNKSGMIKHDDQFRGVEYSYLDGIRCAGSHFNYVSPDFINLCLTKVKDINQLDMDLNRLLQK